MKCVDCDKLKPTKNPDKVKCIGNCYDIDSWWITSSIYIDGADKNCNSFVAKENTIPAGGKQNGQV